MIVIADAKIILFSEIAALMAKKCPFLFTVRNFCLNLQTVNISTDNNQP